MIEIFREVVPNTRDKMQDHLHATLSVVFEVTHANTLQSSRWMFAALVADTTDHRELEHVKINTMDRAKEECRMAKQYNPIQFRRIRSELDEVTSSSSQRILRNCMRLYHLTARIIEWTCLSVKCGELGLLILQHHCRARLKMTTMRRSMLFRYRRSPKLLADKKRGMEVAAKPGQIRACQLVQWFVRSRKGSARRRQPR